MRSSIKSFTKSSFESFTYEDLLELRRQFEEDDIAIESSSNVKKTRSKMTKKGEAPIEDFFGDFNDFNEDNTYEEPERSNPVLNRLEEWETKTEILVKLPEVHDRVGSKLYGL